MKTKSVLCILFATLVTTCSNEEKITASDVPPAVSSALMEKFPDAKDIAWELEKEGDNLLYEAEFESGGKEKEAHFKTDGTLVDED
jgi:hypothetical protein